MKKILSTIEASAPEASLAVTVVIKTEEIELRRKANAQKPNKLREYLKDNPSLNLNKVGLGLNNRPASNMTALHRAAKQGDLLSMAILLIYGATDSLHIIDKDDNTPLDYLADKRLIMLARLLRNNKVPLLEQSKADVLELQDRDVSILRIIDEIRIDIMHRLPETIRTMSLGRIDHLYSLLAGIDCLPTEFDTKKILNIPRLGYAMSIKRASNPDDSKQIALYAGSCGDLASLLLSTNASKLVMVDIAGFNTEYLKCGLLMRQLGMSFPRVSTVSRYKVGYLQVSEFPAEIKDYTPMVLLKDLQDLGVDSATVSFDEASNSLSFRWTHPDSGQEKKYQIYLVESDICDHEKWLSDLRSRGLDLSETGLDYFYQKAGAEMADFFESYLPAVFPLLQQKEGYLLTSTDSIRGGSKAAYGELIGEVGQIDCGVNSLDSLIAPYSTVDMLASSPSCQAYYEAITQPTIDRERGMLVRCANINYTLPNIFLKFQAPE
jgi:ankyrin repeat protein